MLSTTNISDINIDTNRRNTDYSSNINRQNTNINNEDFRRNSQINEDYFRNSNINNYDWQNVQSKNDYWLNADTNNDDYKRKMRSSIIDETFSDNLLERNDRRDQVKQRITTIRAPMLLPVPNSLRRKVYQTSSKERRVEHVDTESDISEINYRRGKHIDNTVIDKDPYVYADAVIEIPNGSKLKRRSHSRRRRTRSDTDLKKILVRRSVVGSSDEYDQHFIYGGLDRRFRGSDPEVTLIPF